MLFLCQVGGYWTGQLLWATPAHSATEAGTSIPVTTSPLSSQEVRYGTGSWDAKSLGNHRAVLKVTARAEVVWAHLPWRRHDSNPEKKNLIVVEAGTGQRVTNLVRVAVSNASGDILFQALNPGFFYAYYLPSVSRGKNYPTGSYPLPEETAGPAWLAKNGLDSRKGAQLTAGNLPRAACVELQAIEEFDSFYPMEIAATPEEESQLAAAISIG